MKRTLPLLVFLGSLTGFFCRISFSATYGTVETGLLALEKKHPYYLFVPPEYSPDKSWPLLILLIGGLEDQKKGIEPWVDWAKKNQLLVLFPNVLPKEGSVSIDSVDRWILGLKKEVEERYNVASYQILLVGIELGGHYAAYLGMNYPEEFRAAALFRRAWVGSFEKLMRPGSNREKQVSFFVAVDPESPSFGAIEERAARLQQKGYPVKWDPLKEDEDILEIRDRMIQWFLEESEARRTRVKVKRKSGLKGTLQEIRKNLFAF